MIHYKYRYLNHKDNLNHCNYKVRNHYSGYNLQDHRRLHHRLHYTDTNFCPNFKCQLNEKC